MPKHGRLALAIVLGALAPLACSGGSNTTTGGAGTSGSAGTSGAAGTGSPQGAAGTGSPQGAAGTGDAQGAAGTGSAQGTAGTGVGAAGTGVGAAGTGVGAAGTGAGAAGTGAGAAGTGAAGAGKAGTGGAGTTGAAGTGAGAAGTTGAAGTGDTPPPKPLNITVAPGQHVHNIFGNSVGMDNRSAKMAGKLIVELGVDSGGYDGWLGKRGFHVFGVKFYHCSHIDSWGAPYGRNYHRDCRWTTFDGVKRGGAENDANTNTSDTDNIAYKLKTGLAMLEQQFPGEGWGYFLNTDGSVRWSDIGFTGYSHGAQTAASLAHLVRLYRAVSRSGPRDNNCGKGTGACPVNPAAPPYDPACAMTGIAAWQDEPFVTPKERVYSFAGTQDGQYGDDQFSLFHMNYPGASTKIAQGDAGPYNSNRFCADAGHGGFEDYTAAINEAFGVLPENKNPNF